MYTEITVIRHAPTEYNKKGIFMGVMDIPIEDTDKLRIEELRELLSQKAFDAYYSSPLIRAKQTSNLIFPDVEPKIDKRLIERDLGIWADNYKNDIKRKYPESFRNGIMDVYYTPEKGEDYRTFVLRVADFIVDKSLEYKSVMVVTHNGVFRVMKSLITGTRLSEVFSSVEPHLEPQTLIVTDEVFSKIKENPFYTTDR